MAGEEVVYELEDNDVPGLSPSKRKMQLTYFETSMVATGDSETEAMNNVALEMLKVIVRPSSLSQHIITACLGIWSLDR